MQSFPFNLPRYGHVTNLSPPDTNTPNKFSLGSVPSNETNLSSKRSFSPPCCPKSSDTMTLKDSNHLGSDKLNDSNLDSKSILNRFPSPTTTGMNLSKPAMDTSPSSDCLDASFNPQTTTTTTTNSNPVGDTLLTSMDSASNMPNSNAKWQDPLHGLARRTGARSKYNALLRWCQSRVKNYPGVEITNLSSSWNNGLALCALLHSFVPSKIPWNELVNSNGLPVDKRYCFEVAFHAAESDGISTTLGLQEMLTKDRPNWNDVMAYVTAIYQRYDANSSDIPGVPNS